jgi:hypothetical protein
MIMKKKNPALLDIYHASIRLDSVFFHGLTRDKHRWSSTLPNSEIPSVTLHYYVRRTCTSL